MAWLVKMTLGNQIPFSGVRLGDRQMGLVGAGLHLHSYKVEVRLGDHADYVRVKV